MHICEHNFELELTISFANEETKTIIVAVCAKCGETIESDEIVKTLNESFELPEFM